MAMADSPRDSWTLQKITDPEHYSINGASEERVRQANRIKQVRLLNCSIMGESLLLSSCDTAQGWTSSCTNYNLFSSTSKICITFFENTSTKIPLTSLLLSHIKMLLLICPAAPAHITEQAARTARTAALGRLHLPLPAERRKQT